MKPFSDANQAALMIVRSALRGNKLKKLDGSIAIPDESMAQGSWVMRGKVKADSGFYQGFARVDFEQDYLSKDPVEKMASSLEFCLNFGRPFVGNIDKAVALFMRRTEGLKISEQQIRAWVALTSAKWAAVEMLDEARPKPVITPIGLSPKVTKTLQEMNLDIDLPTIRMADLEKITVQMTVIETVDGKLQFRKVFEKDGVTPVMTSFFRVKWTPGILHNKSRFAHNGDACHACGKHIPSGIFVPIEAHDRKSGKLVAFWLGVDCARNIFGVKDIGITRDSKQAD